MFFVGIANTGKYRKWVFQENGQRKHKVFEFPQTKSPFCLAFRISAGSSIVLRASLQAVQGLLICSERIAQEEDFNGGHMTLEDAEPRSSVASDRLPVKIAIESSLITH